MLFKNKKQPTPDAIPMGNLESAITFEAEVDAVYMRITTPMGGGKNRIMEVKLDGEKIAKFMLDLLFAVNDYHVLNGADPTNLPQLHPCICDECEGSNE